MARRAFTPNIVLAGMALGPREKEIQLERVLINIIYDEST